VGVLSLMLGEVKSEVRDQRSEVRDQRSEIRDQIKANADIEY
jgi:hypothetical protein